MSLGFKNPIKEDSYLKSATPKFEPTPKLENAELLEALMQDYDIKIHDFLDVFDTEETILAILQKKRKMTIEEYQKLSSLYSF